MPGAGLAGAPSMVPKVPGFSPEPSSNNTPSRKRKAKDGNSSDEEEGSDKVFIPEIRDLDIDVLFLSGDRSELLYKSLREQTQADIDGLGYTILSDADAQAAVALGIAFQAARGTFDRRQQKGDDIEGSSMLRHGVLPVPAVFAVDRSGTIAFSYINPDYAVRLPADELLAVARTIAAD